MKVPRGDELGPGRRCRVTPLGWELLEGYAQGSEVTPGCRDTEQRQGEVGRRFQVWLEVPSTGQLQVEPMARLRDPGLCQGVVSTRGYCLPWQRQPDSALPPCHLPQLAGLALGGHCTCVRS